LYNLFDGKSFHDVIDDLQRIESKNVKYGQGEDSKFRFHHYDAHGGFDFLLDVYRDETDKEYKARMVKEQQARDRAKESKLKKNLDEEAAERKEYERLKAKFG